MSHLSLTLQIEHEREGSYFTLPFTMPENTAGFSLAYRYERHREEGNGGYTGRKEINIVDLGLVAPDGTLVGASGSDKREIAVSEVSATLGYDPYPLSPGEWQIIVGAYKIAPEGVTVEYELEFTPKQGRWLKGDLHAHTLASDGVLTMEELGQRALRHGLNFLAITDHNHMVSAAALPAIPGLTILPGVEWTHYRGHANMLGVYPPYDGSFAANTAEEVQSLFETADRRGALIMINHPFDGEYTFQFDLQTLPFHCLEIWNGPMRESNLRALGYWQAQLAGGKKIPAVGGSDYHRDSLFLFPGGPTTCVYAMSSGASDILQALRRGHAYIIFSPQGPSLEMSAGEAMMGDSVPWAQAQKLHLSLDRLQRGDAVRVVTGAGSETVLEAPADGAFAMDYPINAPGFARVEVWRTFVPGVPQLPALLSNPIYFDQQ